MSERWPRGRRATVRELGESPLEAIRDHLVIEDQDPPDVAGLGDGDVVVGVRAAAVGWVDLLMTSGQYQKIPSPPYTPGLEYAGEVLWVGRSVRRLSVGTRVLADPTRTGPRSTSAYESWGGFATYAVAPATALLELPSGLGFAEAAGLLGGYETAVHALVDRAGVRAGETVLVHGASGVTGLAAVHVAKALGASVIATGRSSEKLAVVAEEGADHVLRLRSSEGGLEPLRDEVRALNAGRGVDAVYDPVGGEITVQSLRCADFGARILIVGWASTPFVAGGKGRRGAPRVNQLPTNLIMMKGLDVLGCPAVISAQRDRSLPRLRRDRVFTWIDEGRFRPRVGHRYSLEDLREALLAKWSSRWVGHLVVEPSVAEGD